MLKEKLATDGTRSTSLTAGYQQNKNPFYSEDSEGSYYLRMTGRDIFDFAVRDVANNIQEVMKDMPVDYLLLHQANLRIIEKIARKVKMPQEKFLTNMDKYGNTSAASIPILLDEAVSSGKITLGKQQKVIFTGYGGGLTWEVFSWSCKLLNYKNKKANNIGGIYYYGIRKNSRNHCRRIRKRN